MKTMFELQYDRSVITRICTADFTSEECIELLVDFHANSETYYDNLCEALLAVSTGQNMSPIWISKNGNCYLSMRTKSAEDRVLLYPDEVPIFDLDLVEQLEIAILKI